jgi:DeoR/GlpR family transcriptional regulator of sugar metabolism
MIILGFRNCRKEFFFSGVFFFIASTKRINRGRGRVIPKQKSEGVLLHRTVEMRMNLVEDEKRRIYQPKAKLIPDVKPNFVD